MQFHAPSGLYLTKYRAYEPQSGRWLSRDPIEEAGGINLYTYVEGNPVSYVDPTGEIAFIPILIGIVGGFALDYFLEDYKKTFCPPCRDTGTPLGQGGNMGMGGIFGGAGPFATKPRVGVHGGGPSGYTTSSFSQINHAAARLYPSAVRLGVRHGVSSALRWLSPKIPYIGVAIIAYEVYGAQSCD
jgi:RHS repeat-associated protein